MGKLRRRREANTADQIDGFDSKRAEESKPRWKPSITAVVALFVLLAALNLAALQYWQHSKPSHIYNMKRDGVEVRILSSPRSRFATDVTKTDTPVVLRNSVVELWKARTRWTPSYLQSKLKNVSGVYENNIRWFGPYYDTRKPLASLTTRVNEYRTDVEMTGKEFFQKLRKPEPGRYLYFTGGIQEFGEWAEKDVQPLKELLAPNPHRSSVNVWVGQPRVVAHCHYDGYHNFYAQLYGTKKFTLFRPTNWPGLYPYPFLHPSHAQAQVNLSNVDDVRDFPLVGQIEAVEVVLEPGDLLYMPPLWFHHVEAMNLSISVNVWTDSHQTEIMETVFGLPLPTSSIDWPDSESKAYATAIMIFTVLGKICQRQVCLSPTTDPFSRNSNLRMSDDRRYLVHCLWSTRYQHLMNKGDVPRNYDIDGGQRSTLLCVNLPESTRRQVHNELVLLDEFSERVSELVKDLPADTWELWVGNYIEYLSATAVGVQHVGVFLMELATCYSGTQTTMVWEPD